MIPYYENDSFIIERVVVYIYIYLSCLEKNIDYKYILFSLKLVWKLENCWESLRACLFTTFENCFYFGKQGKNKERIWFPVFFFFLKNMKNTENTENTIWCSLCFQNLFSIIIFKNKNHTCPKY